MALAVPKKAMASAALEGHGESRPVPGSLPPPQSQGQQTCTSTRADFGQDYCASISAASQNKHKGFVPCGSARQFVCDDFFDPDYHLESFKQIFFRVWLKKLFPLKNYILIILTVFVIL